MSEKAVRLKAVIFDWAGTTIDHGSRAPTQVFVEIFRRCGLEISEAEARGPMGRAKRDHIAALLELPRVVAAWRARHGRPPDASDVDRLYAEFLPLQRTTLARHCDLIPGTIEAVAECRRRGLRIGSTTGYTRELMDVVEPLAAAAGYQPDVTICADEVSQGRPAPWMIFRAAERLNVYPMSSVVVVDDTPVGVEAGRNAGAWTVAVTRSGNALGLSRRDVELLAPHDLQQKLHVATDTFRRCGAHHVIDSVADLPGVLDAIAGRLIPETWPLPSL